jgi:hypothetical protein
MLLTCAKKDTGLRKVTLLKIDLFRLSYASRHMILVLSRDFVLGAGKDK